MPWCDTCSEYRAPSGVRSDGTCPTCGDAVDPGGTKLKVREGDDRLPPVPWHLKFLFVAAAGYLGLRAWQGIELLIDKL